MSVSTLHPSSPFTKRYGSVPITPARPVAYFSPEYGPIKKVEGQYSGGLGILSSCHLKAAAKCGIPMVAIGLLHHYGYFVQALEAGKQVERYRYHDPLSMGLRPLAGVTVAVQVADETMRAQVWECRLGSVRLLLLDANVSQNPPHLRAVTGKLYGGSQEDRMRGEILLGIGGVRVIRALGLNPSVYHFNEGHAGFGILEIIRELVESGMTADAAIACTRNMSAFTTHTPVPAGINKYPYELMYKYFVQIVGECGMDFEHFLGLGRLGTDPWPVFNQAAWSINMTGRTNGVSELHGDVSNEMFASLGQEITHVTNGVDFTTWIGWDMAELLESLLGPDYATCGAEGWMKAIPSVSRSDLWAARNAQRALMVEYVRRVKGWDQLLDENVFTIGFARRVPEYKRLTLMLEEPEQLLGLLRSGRLQVVLAGKAHPHDEPGKALIAKLCAFIDDPEHADIRHRFVFLEDYNAEMAMILEAGCDVWMNTPEYGKEACGTSGMKAALNGAINLTIPDGWCFEMIEHLVNGFLIGEARSMEASELATILYDLLENKILPMFYDRTPEGLPLGWLELVVKSLETLGWRVSNLRMMDEYMSKIYGPASRADLSAVA